MFRDLCKIGLSSLFTAAVSLAAGLAHAGTSIAVGNVTALTNINKLPPHANYSDFKGGTVNTGVLTNIYAAKGFTWASGSFSSILNGVMEPGTANLGIYTTSN